MIKGFIAITSSIVISLVIMTVVFAVSFTGFFNRSNISDSYYKQISKFVAESCVETALLKLGLDPLYGGSEIRSVNSDQCEIKPVETPIGLPLVRIIKTKSIIQGAVTNLKVTATFPLLEILFWEELENL